MSHKRDARLSVTAFFKLHTKLFQYFTFARFSNPNKPGPVSSQTWPTYRHDERQYFRILRNQSADAIGKDLVSRHGMFLWNYVEPTMLEDAKKAQAIHDCVTDGGSAVYGTVVIIAICSYLSMT